MGGTCGTCVTKLNSYTVVLANLKEREYVEILSVGGKIILKWVKVFLTNKCTIY
jgi:hypothetical protein